MAVAEILSKNKADLKRNRGNLFFNRPKKDLPAGEEGGRN